MNKSLYSKAKIIITLLRCLSAIVLVLINFHTVNMKKQLVYPIRKWIGYITFYSNFIPLLVLSVSILNYIIPLKDSDMRKNKGAKLTYFVYDIRDYFYILVTTLELLLLTRYSFGLCDVVETISKDLNETLHTGLNRYYSNSDWKIFWDDFQQQNSCCGVTKSTNWFQVAWVTPTTVPSLTILKKYTQSNGMFILPSAPISCCRPTFICRTFIDCHEPNIDKYYHKGCHSIIHDMLSSLLYFRFVCYFIIIIQVIFMVMVFKTYQDNKKTLCN